MDLRAFFLKQKQAVHRGTLDVLSKIPVNEIAWRPAEGMLSLGEIARHVWMSEEGIRHAALGNNWEYYAKRVPQGLFAILGVVKAMETELAQIERVHQQTLHEVALLPAERLEDECISEEFKVRRRVAVMLFGIVEHEIHHRAQVGAYLHILTANRASPYAL